MKRKFKFKGDSYGKVEITLKDSNDKVTDFWEVARADKNKLRKLGGLLKDKYDINLTPDKSIFEF